MAFFDSAFFDAAFFDVAATTGASAAVAIPALALTEPSPSATAGAAAHSTLPALGLSPATASASAALILAAEIRIDLPALGLAPAPTLTPATGALTHPALPALRLSPPAARADATPPSACPAQWDTLLADLNAAITEIDLGLGEEITVNGIAVHALISESIAQWQPMTGRESRTLVYEARIASTALPTAPRPGDSIQRRGRVYSVAAEPLLEQGLWRVPLRLLSTGDAPIDDDLAAFNDALIDCEHGLGESLIIAGRAVNALVTESIDGWLQMDGSETKTIAYEALIDARAEPTAPRRGDPITRAGRDYTAAADALLDHGLWRVPLRRASDTGASDT